MVSDLVVWRSPKLLLDRYGEGTALIATNGLTSRPRAFQAAGATNARAIPIQASQRIAYGMFAATAQTVTPPNPAPKPQVVVAAIRPSGPAR